MDKLVYPNQIQSLACNKLIDKSRWLLTIAGPFCPYPRYPWGLVGGNPYYKAGDRAETLCNRISKIFARPVIQNHNQTEVVIHVGITAEDQERICREEYRRSLRRVR